MDELLKKKIIAFFHDPPWKMWVVRPGGKALLADSGGHVEDAKELIKKIGIEIDGGFQGDFPDEIRAADHFSSTFDRWIINSIEDMLKSHSCTFAGPRHKLNIFSPGKKIPLDTSQINRESVEAFVKKLSQLVSKLNDKKYTYHVLYFLTPLLWYKEFPNKIPLADTRVPTHTIFDHSAATSSMINIVVCNNGKLNIEGYMATVEIPSIQEFISYSRKTRELWASSWLSSLLLWKSIEAFVEDYGPDVVIRPELSLNHFFISWLLGKLNSSASSELKDELLRMAKAYAHFTSPTIPMMSEKVYLILPRRAGASKEEVREKIEKRFYEAWKIIAETSLKDILKDIEDSRKTGEYEQYISYIKESVEKPPIKPIINVIDLQEEYNNYKEKLNVNYDPPCRKYLDENFLCLFQYLMEKVKEYESVKHVYGSLISPSVVSGLTDKRYRLCNICGIMPVVFKYVIENNLKENKENIVLGYGSKESEDKSKYIEEEWLCPYCAIKRNMRPKIIEEILKNMGLYYDEKNKIKGFPSVSAISMKNLLDKLNESNKYHLEYDDYCTSMIAETLCENYSSIARGGKISYDKIKVCHDKIKDINEMLKEIGYDKIKKYGDIYYAVVRADGDFLGRGYWNADLRECDNGNRKKLSLEDYIKKVLIESLGKECINKLWSDIAGKIGKIRENSKKLQLRCDVSTLITPAYIYTLSRSLTAQSVIDLDILERNGATPVYIGGDDLLALSPIYHEDGRSELSVLNLVEETRRSYWQYSSGGQQLSNDGFKVVSFKNGYGGIIIDSLRPYGRSYAIYISHYKDPLSLSLFLSAELLEKKDMIAGKDVLFVAYGRGIANEQDIAMIRLGDGCNFIPTQIDLLRSLYEGISSSNISVSLIYDTIGPEGLRKYLREKCSDDIKYKLIERTIRRNVRGDGKIISNLLDKVREASKGSKGLSCNNDFKSVCNRDPFIQVVLALSILR